MKNMQCLIVDDEPLAIDVLENYLQRLDNIETTRCENGIDAMRLLRERQFDIMFLDIEMPLLTGLDVLKNVSRLPAVIITTAYRDYAVEGFEFDVVDYLLKPMSFARFMKAFERAMKLSAGLPAQETQVPDEHIFIKVDKSYVKILLDDILFIESQKDNVKIVTRSGAFVTYQSLTSITDGLNNARFLRVHRSFTIAIDKVTRIKGNNVEIGEVSIPLSRELKASVVSRILNENSGLE